MHETTPQTMRALVLEAPGVLRVSEIPVPEPGPGELLLRVRAATTCGTDLKAFVRGHPQIPMPGPFGHEFSGVVARAGDGAPFAPGQEVMGVHSAPCQRCAWCLRGQENLCESIMATKVLGSFAQYLLIPERIARLNAFVKPADLSFERASLLEPLACVAQALSAIGDVSGARILVLGPGAIGLMFVAALRRLGCGEVALAGRSPERLAAGHRLGARAVRHEELAPLAGDGFDVVIECTGDVGVWERAPAYARRGGTVVLFGGCPSGTVASFDTGRLHYDQIALISPFHFGTRAVLEAREWLLDPSMDLDPLITGRRPLEDGPDVFRELQAGRGIKVVLLP